MARMAAVRNNLAVQLRVDLREDRPQPPDARPAGRPVSAALLILLERTFSWFGRNRRLAKDFENLAETLATFVTPRFHPASPQAACQGVGLQSM